MNKREREKSNGSIMSVDMDVVGVTAAYLPVVRVCTALSGEALPMPWTFHRQCLCRQCSTHTHHRQISCHNTDYVHVNGRDRTITVILAKNCIKLPDDESLVIRNMLEHF